MRKCNVSFTIAEAQDVREILRAHIVDTDWTELPQEEAIAVSAYKKVREVLSPIDGE